MESFESNQYEDLLESVRDLPLIFSLGVVIGEDIPESIIRMAKRGRPKNGFEKLQIAAAYHHHQIIEAVPSTDRALVSQINIGFQPTRILNALAAHDRNSGAFSITLNSSLDLFLNRMSVLFFNLINPTFGPREKVRLVQIAVPQLSSMMFAGEKETYSELVDLPDTQWYWHLAILSFFAMRFIIAHEVGHILGGHTERPAGDMSSWSPTHLFRHRREESDVDCFACRLIIKSLCSIEQGRKPIGAIDCTTVRDLGLIAPIVVFLWLHQLNKLRGKEEMAISAHPTEKMRLDMVKEIVCPQLSSKYREYVRETEKIWKAAEDMSPDEAPEHVVSDSHELYFTLLSSVASELSVCHYESAISYARAAITLEPGRWNAYELFAVALSESGRQKEAIGILRRLVRDFPDNAELCYNLAVDLLDVGEVSEATVHLERVCQMEPENSEALEKLLVIYRKRNTKDHVLRIVKRLLPLAHDDDRVLYYIAEAFIECHQYEEALSCLQRALELSPGDEVYGVLMSDVLSLMGRHTDALRQYMKQTRIVQLTHGDRSKLFATLAEMMASEEYDEIITLIHSHLEVCRDDPELLSRLLVCYVQLEQYEAGIEIGEKLVKSDKADLADFLMLGQAFIATGETERAEECFQKVITQSENTINELLPEQYALRRMTEEALAGAYFYLGNCSFGRGLHHEALDWWQRSVDLLPNEDTVGNLLLGYLKTGNWEALISVGLEAIEGGLEGTGIFYNLASAYAYKGEAVQAIKYLQKARTLDANVAELAREDDSFISIRDDDLFRAFLA